MKSIYHNFKETPRTKHTDTDNNLRPVWYLLWWFLGSSQQTILYFSSKEEIFQKLWRLCQILSSLTACPELDQSLPSLSLLCLSLAPGQNSNIYQPFFVILLCYLRQLDANFNFICLCNFNIPQVNFTNYHHQSLSLLLQSKYIIANLKFAI